MGEDARFPSGPWTGFYTYHDPSDRHRMDLRLEFSGGRIDGSGTDDIAPFTIRGAYALDTGVCTWVKAYASHTVDYRGFAEGKGIWGRWTIGARLSGGFHIWPLRAGESALEVEQAIQATAPFDLAPTPSRAQ